MIYMINTISIYIVKLILSLHGKEGGGEGLWDVGIEGSVRKENVVVKNLV